MSGGEGPTSRRARVGPVLAAAMGLLSMLGASSADRVGASAAARSGEEPPIRFPLRLERVPGGDETLVQPGAAVLHLVFLASWCPPCVDELPRLADLESRWVDRGYRLVLVAVSHRQSQQTLRKLVEDVGPAGEILHDRSGSVQKQLGVDRLPTHLLVDRDGRIVHRSGFLDGGVETAILDMIDSRGRPPGRSR